MLGAIVLAGAAEGGAQAYRDGLATAMHLTVPLLVVVALLVATTTTTRGRAAQG